MEYLRDDEMREVNHHGTSMEVDGDQKLFKNKVTDGENITKEATRIENTRSGFSFYMMSICCYERNTNRDTHILKCILVIWFIYLLLSICLK